MGSRKKIAVFVLAATVVLAVFVTSALARARAHEQKAAKPPASVVAAGKKVFKANCATCHTLKEASTHGTVGPNLDTLHLPLATIQTQVTQGGRFMPAFSVSAGGALNATQIKDVATFVYSAEHK